MKKEDTTATTNYNDTERWISRVFSLSPQLSLTRMLKWPGCSRVQITCTTLGTICKIFCATRCEGIAQQLSLAEWKLQ